VVDAATGGLNIATTPAEIAAGAAVGGVIGGAAGTLVDWLNNGGRVILAENTKSILNKIDGLVNTAREHADKCALSSPEDPNQNKRRNEAKAALDRARRLARRLPTKLQQKTLSAINSIEGLL